MKEGGRGGWFEYIAWGLIISLSLALCVPFALSHRDQAMSPDSVLYSDIALHLLRGQGFEQEVRSYPIVVPPLFSIFLAGIYLVFGTGNVVAVLLVQSLLKALTAGLIYLIGKALFNRWVGLMAGILYAGYAMAIFWNGFVLTETLFTFFVALFAYMLLRFLGSQPSYRDAVVVGAVWGPACLIRPHLLLFVPVFALWLCFIQRRQGFRLTLMTLVTLGLTVAPWIGYLYAKYGFFIPIASHGALALWLGNSPFTNPNVYYHSKLYVNNPLFLEAYRYAQGLPFKEQTAFYNQEAWQFIIGHPAQFLTNTYGKAVLLWETIKLGALPLRVTSIPALRWLDQIVKSTDHWLVVLLLPGLVISLFWGFRRNQILLWLILYYTLATSLAIIVSGGRYRLPIMPLVTIYTGLPLYSVVYVACKAIQLAAQGLKRGG